MKREYYQDRANSWRWRITAANHKIIAASSESFESKQMAQKNLRLLKEALLPKKKEKTT